MELAAGFLPWILTAISIATLYINSRNFRTSQEKIQKEHAAELRRMAQETCRAFVHSDEFTGPRDKRIEEVAQRVVDQNFSQRASSFVDAAVYDRDLRHFGTRLESLEASNRQLVKELGVMNGTLAQLTAFLRIKLGFVDTDEARKGGSRL